MSPRPQPPAKRTNKGAGGRPCELTQEVHDAVVKARRAGLSWEDAATLAGVSARSLANWRQQGAEDEAAGRNTRFFQLLQGATRARAEKRAKALELIHELGEGIEVEREGKDGETKIYSVPPDRNALTWFLERTDPENFGRQRLDLGVGAREGNPGVTLQVVTGILRSPEDAREPTAEALAAAGRATARPVSRQRGKRK